MSEDGQLRHTAASAPPGTTVYAVGDIHGRLDLFERLVARIRDDAARRRTSKKVLVLVGDYIDRGPDSAGVIDHIIHRLPAGYEVHCLLGNHEKAMLDFIEDPASLPHWLSNGAAETFISYGVEPPNEDGGRHEFNACRDALLAAMAASHRNFLANLELYLELGGYLFVHAGIRPGIEMQKQSTHDLLWIREDFLDCDEDLGRVVIHGHTPDHEPVVRRNRIGIDTGAVAYGCLTAVRLEGSSYEFLQVRE